MRSVECEAWSGECEVWSGFLSHLLLSLCLHKEDGLCTQRIYQAVELPLTYLSSK